MLTLSRCLFHPRVTAVATDKDPGHSAKRAGGRLHLNTHTSFTQRSRSRLTMLSRLWEPIKEASSHATRQQSFQLAEPLWTDPGPNNGTGERKLISTQKKKCRQGINCPTIQQSSNARKKLPNPAWCPICHRNVSPRSVLCA